MLLEYRSMEYRSMFCNIDRLKQIFANNCMQESWKIESESSHYVRVACFNLKTAITTDPSPVFQIKTGKCSNCITF